MNRLQQVVDASSPGDPPPSDGSLRAGASRVLITPPLGRPLAGYPQRKAKSSVVRDDLFVRCLALESRGDLSAVISLDVMAIDEAWVDELRHRAESKLGIAAERVLVAATHTHSGHGELLTFGGPLGSAIEALFGESEGPFDPVAYEYLMRQALTGLELAVRSLQSARIRIGTDVADHVASNRVDPETPADPTCHVIVVETPANDPIAQLVHFACHPSVLGDGDSGVSADFPGVVSRTIEGTIGGVCLYLNGALGDVSTRFTRRGHGHTEAVRFGLIVAGAVLRAVGTAAELAVPRLDASIVAVPLPPKGRPRIDGAAVRVARLRNELEQAVSAGLPHGRVRQIKTGLQGAEIAVALGPRLEGLREVPVSVQRLSLGPTLDLVAFPAEMFSGLAALLRNAVPDRTVLCVSPANGYLGYMPTTWAFETGGYEADTCIVDAGAGESLVAAVVEAFYGIPLVDVNFARAPIAAEAATAPES